MRVAGPDGLERVTCTPEENAFGITDEAAGVGGAFDPCSTYDCGFGRCIVRAKHHVEDVRTKEQIVFTEMFPPLCQRIKIQLKENDSVRINFFKFIFFPNTFLEFINHKSLSLVLGWR